MKDACALDKKKRNTLNNIWMLHMVFRNIINFHDVATMDQTGKFLHDIMGEMHSFYNFILWNEF